MFDIGWSEMAVIAVVALIVIGPRDLPRLLYTAGKLVAKARATLHEFQQGIADMAREAELEEVRDKIRSARNFDAESVLNKALDPEGDVRKALDVDPERVAQPLPAPVTSAEQTPSSHYVSAPEPAAEPVSEPLPVQSETKRDGSAA